MANEAATPLLSSPLVAAPDPDLRLDLRYGLADLADEVREVAAGGPFERDWQHPGKYRQHPGKQGAAGLAIVSGRPQLRPCPMKEVR